MDTKRVLRLIIDDHEDVIYWDDEVTKPIIHDLVVYIVDQFRKKFSTDSFTFRNFEGTNYQIENIAQNLVSPIFILATNQKNIQTAIKVDPRTFKNVYIFKTPEVVRIQKFEKVRRIEETELKMTDIRAINDSLKSQKFEVAELSKELSKMKIEARQAKGPEEKASPTFDSPKTNLKADGKPTGNMTYMLRPDQTATATDRSKVEKSAPNSARDQSSSRTTEVKKAAPVSGKPELQNYTLQEVAQHNTASNAWMVINGKVYDVTRYIPFHPGGQKIMAGVGKDGTAMFNKYHSWVNAEFVLAKYHIGFLKK